MSKLSALEKVTSGLPAKSVANAVAAFGATATPLAAFVPFLVDFLAAGRQSKRLEAMIQDLKTLVERNSDKIMALTDDQYKVVNEAISAAFYTIDQDKLELLKRAASNAFLHSESVANLSDSLSRIVRDISAVEAAFIIRNFGYEFILLSTQETDNPKALTVSPGSNDEIIISGLINLGLLYTKVARYDSGAFEWSPLVVKLIRLISDA